ncbi:hypothetical protein D3C72_534950 [compost metagenome]
MPTPSQARSTWPLAWSCGRTVCSVPTGTAKPMPWPRAAIAVFTPITSPRKLSSGPPELPGLIGASVCKKSTREFMAMSRLIADRMPEVTVCERPKGLPTATTNWPTRRLLGSASLRVVRFLALMRTSARSVLGSRPITWPSCLVPSARVTVSFSAPFTTW